MFNLVEIYIKKMRKEDINNFALTKDIHLSEEELNFTYDFVKKNYKTYFQNSKLFDIYRYQNKFSKENFNKIVKVYEEYTRKYANYL